jgi:hypothetical protein
LTHGYVKQCRVCGAVSAGAAQRKYKDILPDVAAKNTAAYQAWASMRFSAKKIRVPLEPAWEDFRVCFADLGRRPDEEGKWVLGRINSELGYVRGNVQWQPLLHRQRHKVTSLWWHVHGERFSSANAAAEALGVSRGTIRNWCQGPRDRKTGKRSGPRVGCWAEPQFPERK